MAMARRIFLGGGSSLNVIATTWIASSPDWFWHHLRLQKPECTTLLKELQAAVTGEITQQNRPLGWGASQKLAVAHEKLLQILAVNHQICQTCTLSDMASEMKFVFLLNPRCKHTKRFQKTLPVTSSHRFFMFFSYLCPWQGMKVLFHGAGSANLGGAQLLREEVHMAPGAVVVTNSRGQEGSMEVEMANFDSFLPETNSKST